MTIHVLPDQNTRFALPIVDPFKGDVVSAETLYNRACADMGRAITDHIGDLVLDNLDYSAGPRDDAALCAAVYAWADRVREQLAAAERNPPHVICSRIDHRTIRWQNCECQQCNPYALYDAAMRDKEFARDLFDASKGGNVPGITEDHRYDLAQFFNRPECSLIVGDRLHIDENFGTETSVVRVYADTLMELRRYVRENNVGSLPIHSDYDCTGLICGQYAKFIKIWRTHGGYTALVEFSVTRDV